MGKDKVIECAFAKAFLYRSELGNRLLERYLSAEQIYHLPQKELMEAVGADVDFVKEIFSPDNLLWAEQEVKWAESKDVQLIFRGEEGYPRLLYECEDAPVMLFYRGTADLNNPKVVSIVGTRLASAYGRECCQKVVDSVVNYNPLIVSGLAYGIDITAHKAAMDKGLETVAVLPNGLDMIYPLRHRGYAADMVKCGGVLTEFPRGMKPLRHHFIKRNRIIAAMADAVVIVESRVKGGAMTTIEFASLYNRDIFAVPGRVSDPNSYGCNYLISKNIAAIYLCEASIPSALGWNSSDMSFVRMQPNLFSGNNNNKEKILLTLKVLKKANMDLLSLKTGFEWGVLSMLLLDLELEGKISVNPMKEYYLRND